MGYYVGLVNSLTQEEIFISSWELNEKLEIEFLKSGVDFYNLKEINSWLSLIDPERYDGKDENKVSIRRMKDGQPWPFDSKQVLFC